MSTLQGWLSNAGDSLDLMWAEPLSWLIMVAAVVLVGSAARRAGHLEPLRAVAGIGVGVWLVAALAVTIYPLDYVAAPAAHRLELKSVVPLAGTIEALANSGDWIMSPEELAAQQETMAIDLGIPAAEIDLDPRVRGPGIAAVLKDPIGNVVLFVPFGFLAPLVWPAMRRLRYTALAGAGVSAAIELSQLLFGLGSLGTIDDVIFNTLGACLGFAGWVVVRHAVDSMRGRTPLGRSLSERERDPGRQGT